MQTGQSVKKATRVQPKERTLTIQPKHRVNEYSVTIAPEIKLCGNWLRDWGFPYGARVTVTHIEEGLLIRLVEELAV